jgi:phage terminase large subunit GpA-like protein
MLCSTSTKILSPPERLSISDAAEKYRYVKVQGAYQGQWDNETAPYMVQPMDMLNSRTKSSVIFVGPAQSGKTDALIINWTLFGAVVDPMDMIIYCPTHAAAKDFSIRRVDRLGRDSKAMVDAKLRDRDADNKFEKTYANGMLLTLSWPSVTEFAGRPIGRVAITDYDRIVDDIDGEGSAYDLAVKRTTTFGSFAMCMAESSPSREVKDPKKIVQGHEAPPCEGILSLYNRGDRRKWYWPCPHCGNYFSPKFEYLTYSSYGDNVTRSETVAMVCPHHSCGLKIPMDQRTSMNSWGVWLADGQSIDRGRIVGEARRSLIASYWLEGTAAAFITWAKLVNNYLDAMDDYESTGSEEALKKFYNTDLGRPYIPKSMESERLPEVLMSRAEPLPEKIVPPEVRVIVMAVDVQKNAFVVQAHGVCPGRPYDLIVIDRFDIQRSERTFEEGHEQEGEHRFVKPGTYAEDWDLLIEQVILRTYPLGDGQGGLDPEGRRMQVKMTICDSGGSQRASLSKTGGAKKGGISGSGGVTANAYAFQRKIRKLGLAGRFHLVRGGSSATAPRWKISYPDSSNSNNKAAAQGDVPVLMLNGNSLKDQLSNLLDVIEPMKGMIRFPNWLESWFFDELCAEVRTDTGWVNPKKRNEAWDLLYYTLGVLASPLVPLEKLDWNNAPLWAGPWDSNPLVNAPEKADAAATSDRPKRNFGSLGAALG